MNVSHLRRRPLRLFAGLAGVSCLVLALGAAASPASPSAITSLPGQLLGVSAVSASDAWAVGAGGTGTLTLHWDGASWTKVASPSPGSLASLAAVAAVSRSDVWAVGSYRTSSGGNKTLILHWNGTSWTRVPSPSPEVTDGSFLTGVSAVSASGAWAVGWYYLTGGEASNTLILHWNGTSWTRMPSPNPSHLGFNALNSVSALSAAAVWAAGSIDTGTLILRGNGTSWARVPSPGTVAPDVLNGVSAVSASDAWAAGATAAGTLLLHWNGTSWTRVPSPDPAQAGNFSLLNSVSAVSASDAWAAGTYSTTSSGTKSLALHWNGVTWAQVATPNPGGATGTSLAGISATSPYNAWAVGDTSPGSGGKTLILHWNGNSWTRF